MILWQFICKHPLCKKLDRGYEFLLLAPVLILAVFCAIKLGPVAEAAFFGGNFKLWLFSEAGVRYDGRNNIIIAFALGFAVIPIIFTMAEDALSNVPGSLKAASLALGASRWQTVWRVILPSGSPGIFAGTMIGFGRAIGETMIVLMATGNTAIMDWSIFNGMRPLSANIAVEIPEAPVDGSLYRVLFLSAVILFCHDLCSQHRGRAGSPALTQKVRPVFDRIDYEKLLEKRGALYLADRWRFIGDPADGGSAYHCGAGERSRGILAITRRHSHAA